MPVDRLLHPRIGDSDKVAKLTDMEFRVWIAYMLAADDFGVLPMSAAKIQGADRTLGTRRSVQIDRALTMLVQIGLVLRFIHQGQPFICSPTWQSHQRIRYPRKTHYPAPSPKEMKLCNESTQALFREYHCNIPETDPESSGNVSTLPRAGTRETAMANGNGKRLTAEGENARERFERFWTEYPRKVGKDAAWKEWLKRSPSNDLTDQMIVATRQQRTSRDWLKDGGQFIPHPRTWLHQGRWEDRPVELPTISDKNVRNFQAAKDFIAS